MEWLSGFSGSNGQVVLTMDQALLWTDGRYHHHCDCESQFVITMMLVIYCRVDICFFEEPYDEHHHRLQSHSLQSHRHHVRDCFRYFIQAADQLDCQWKLMKMGEEGVRMVVMITMVIVVMMMMKVMVMMKMEE